MCSDPRPTIAHRVRKSYPFSTQGDFWISTWHFRGMRGLSQAHQRTLNCTHVPSRGSSSIAKIERKRLQMLECSLHVAEKMRVPGYLRRPLPSAEPWVPGRGARRPRELRMVGRYFMEHPTVDASLLASTAAFPTFYDQGLLEPQYFSSLSLTAETLRREGVLSYHSASTAPSPAPRPAGRRGGSRGGLLEPFSPTMLEDARTILAETGGLALPAIKESGLVSLPQSMKMMSITHMIEQLPNPDSPGRALARPAQPARAAGCRSRLATERDRPAHGADRAADHGCKRCRRASLDERHPAGVSRG